MAQAVSNRDNLTRSHAMTAGASASGSVPTRNIQLQLGQYACTAWAGETRAINIAGGAPTRGIAILCGLPASGSSPTCQASPPPSPAPSSAARGDSHVSRPGFCASPCRQAVLDLVGDFLASRCHVEEFLGKERVLGRLGEIAITFGLVPQIIRPIHSSPRYRPPRAGELYTKSNSLTTARTRSAALSTTLLQKRPTLFENKPKLHSDSKGAVAGAPDEIRGIRRLKRIRLQMKGPRREVEPRRGPPPNHHLGGSPLGGDNHYYSRVSGRIEYRPLSRVRT